jgi:uncharacterized protein (TIGR00304 family)
MSVDIHMDTLLMTGITFMVIGFLLVSIGLTRNNAKAGTEVRSGGVVLLGPFPIIFGNDNGAITVAVIGAIVLMAISIALLVLSR